MIYHSFYSEFYQLSDSTNFNHVFAPYIGLKANMLPLPLRREKIIAFWKKNQNSKMVIAFEKKI